MLESNENDTATVTHFLQILKDSDFKIIKDIDYKKHTFTYVAERTTTGLLLGAIREQVFIIFAEFSSLDMVTLREFHSDCRRYARRHRFIPYLPLIGRVICFPIALSHSVDIKASKSLIEANPTVGIGYTEVPVIVDLTNKQAWYSKKTSWFGQLALPFAREILSDLLQRWEGVKTQ